MLASPAMVDATICHRAPANGPTHSPVKFGTVQHVDAHHSFADASKLHPGIRPALDAAGFDLANIPMPGGLRGWTDENLLSVQSAARSILKGSDVSMSARMRAMADVAAMVLSSEER
jgi:hypothetical protein